MMFATRRSTRLLTLLGAATLVACTSDRPSVATTEPIDAAPSSVLSGASDCSVTAISGFAKTYFGSANNIASNDIKGLADACRAWVGARGTATAIAATRAAAELKADGHGFGVFKSIASVSKAREGFAGAGADLTVGVLRFMTIWDEATPDATSLKASLTSALGANGMYAVSSPSTAETKKTIFSREQVDRWGILAAWSRQVLVYGHEIGDALSGLPSASVGGAYEISTLPLTSGNNNFASPFSVGVCFGSYVNGAWVGVSKNINDATRVQHRNVPDFLPTSQEDLCGSQYATTSTTFGTRMLALADAAVGFFAPRDLYAFPIGTKTGVGGFGSDLSPFYTPDLGELVVSYATQPTDNSSAAGIIPPVRVLVETLNGDIIVPGAAVVLSVANNSGTPAGAELGWVAPAASDCPAPAGSVCRKTGPDGIAIFDGMTANKPGGYLITASASYDGIPSKPLVSNAFNMKQ